MDWQVWQTIGGIVCIILVIPCWLLVAFALFQAFALWTDKTGNGFGFDMVFKITAVAFLAVSGIGGTALSVLAYLALR